MNTKIKVYDHQEMSIHYSNPEAIREAILKKKTCYISNQKVKRRYFLEGVEETLHDYMTIGFSDPDLKTVTNFQLDAETGDLFGEIIFEKNDANISTDDLVEYEFKINKSPVYPRFTYRVTSGGQHGRLPVIEVLTFICFAYRNDLKIIQKETV